MSPLTQYTVLPTPKKVIMQSSFIWREGCMIRTMRNWDSEATWVVKCSFLCPRSVLQVWANSPLSSPVVIIGGWQTPFLPCPPWETIANGKLSCRKELRDWSGLDGFYFRGSCSLGEDGKFSQHLGWSNAAPQDASDCQDFQMTLLSRFRRQNQIPGGSDLELSDFVAKSPHPLSLTITRRAASPSLSLHAFLWLHG